MKARLNWLFADVDLYALALIRILVGLSTLLCFLSFAPYVGFYFSDSGFLPIKVLRELGPLPGLSLLLLSGSSKWVTACYLALLTTSALFTIGVRTRVTGPLLWLLTLSFVNRNVFVFSGVPLLIVQYLLILFFCDSGRVLAWKTPKRLDDGPATGPYGWVFFLLRLQLRVVYFKSGALYGCEPEPDFVCKKYHGNVRNFMNSVAIVEAPAGSPAARSAPDFGEGV